MDYRRRYDAWINDKALDDATRQELLGIQDEKELTDRFFKDLEFGTAGLRGIMGAGSNRMNVYTVGRAAQGLANYLKTLPNAEEAGVAIAFDSRHRSDEFALRSALILAANGIKTYLFPGIRAVPQLSFAVGHLGCAAGIVITASHNPKEYSGFKVYGANGAQINPQTAKKITEQINSVADFSAIRLMEEDAAREAGLLVTIGKEVDEAYFDYTMGLALDPSVLSAAKDLSIVYTPLFGAGAEPVSRVLTAAGVRHLFVVPEQSAPNGDFPGLPAPNPEVAEAFSEAEKHARNLGADLILATDPDADRLGVAVRKGDEFVILTGNQIGCLVLHYRLMKLKEQGKLPKDGFVVKSIVSTNFANAIAQSFGVRLEEVLTGFRFIGEMIDESERTKTGSFLFGFEESYGFLAGTKVRDKDAICAALMTAETAAYYSLRGMTLLDGLHELFEQYGCYCETIKSYTLHGAEGMAKIAAAMEDLRNNPPQKVFDRRVAALRDYSEGFREEGGKKTPLNLPKSNVLYYELGGGDWLCVRPSGTEPKLKVYAGASEGCAEGAKKRVEAYASAAGELLGMDR
ncbi:MAG: phospho-sugar mutase [Christensenellales bacterium]|jgi:phosphoglucomutase